MNDDYLQDGQFWLVRNDEIVIAEKISDYSHLDSPYVILDLYLDPQRKRLVERNVKFFLEVV